MRRIIFLAVLVFPIVSEANNSILAESVRVIDGDTVEILTANGVSERVRLLGIDAPELKQEFGKYAKKTLKTCLDSRSVVVQWQKIDRYERLIGKLLADGVDCNLEQVKQGYAWHYKKYQSNQSEEDQLSYSLAEDKARNLGLGLWKSDNPIAPWAWRSLQPATASNDFNKGAIYVAIATLFFGLFLYVVTLFQ